MITNNLKIPQEVLYIMEVLNQNRHKAHIVGGCVRDSIIGKEPVDWDITTDATPGDIKRLFPKTADTGVKHGTVTVFLDDRSFEVTTYRIDGKYADNRRPETVKFASSIFDDLSRRDFTVNSIAFSPKDGFIDPFGGIRDIENRLIRTVGNPSERFREDALRMLRAVRFSAQLGFSIDGNTIEAIKSNNLLILNVSCERIRDELTKILLSDNPMNMSLLKDTGLLKNILPELDTCFGASQNNPYHIFDVGTHILKSVSFIKKDKLLRWVMLLHDIGKPLTKTTDEKGIDHFYGHVDESIRLAGSVLKRLRFDNKTIKKILKLVEYHDFNIEPSEKAVRRAVSKIGTDIFGELLEVQEADKQAQNPEFFLERLEKLDKVRTFFRSIIEAQQCTTLDKLAINGSDLINIGFKPGKEIGDTLDKLLEAVIENPGLNTRESLLNMAKNLKWQV